MATIEEQIASKLAEITALENRATNYEKSAKEWQAQADAIKPKGFEKKKEQAAKDDRNIQAEANRNLAKSDREKAELLKKDVTALTEQRKKEGEAMVELAKKGETPASTVAKAEGQAKAMVKTAEITAEAQKQTAQADNTNKKMIVISICIVLVVIAIILVMKKLKKVKK